MLALPGCLLLHRTINMSGSIGLNLQRVVYSIWVDWFTCIEEHGLLTGRMTETLQLSAMYEVLVNKGDPPPRKRTERVLFAFV